MRTRCQCTRMKVRFMRQKTLHLCGIFRMEVYHFVLYKNGLSFTTDFTICLKKHKELQDSFNHSLYILLASQDFLCYVIPHHKRE